MPTGAPSGVMTGTVRQVNHAITIGADIIRRRVPADTPFWRTTPISAAPDLAAMSPEASLLLAAVRVDAPRVLVDQVLSAPLDWTRVVELTLAHHLAPAMGRALDAASPGLVPADVLDAFRVYRTRLAAQSGRLTHELAALLSTFDEQSIFVVPFKGPVLAQVLFGDVAQRTPGDLDLLVRRADIRRVRQLLVERGYRDIDAVRAGRDLTDAQRRMYERYQCEYLFVHPDDEVMVEPHWELCQRTLALDVDYEGMLDRAGPGMFATRPIRQLTPDDLLVALCVHGAKHQWERLSWVRDVAGVLATWPGIDLDSLLVRTSDMGCARVLLLSLEVVRRCAGVALPARVAEAIHRDPEAEALASDVVDALFRPRPEPRNDRLEPFRYRMRERRLDRLRYAWLTWTTPRRRHLEMAALPRAFGWGYYPIKIGADYAISPLRQTWRRWTS